MRRLTWIAVAALGLLGAGIAVAHEGHTNTITAVSASFTAATPSNVHSSTCTMTSGTTTVTYTTTRGRWTGSVTGATDASLNGNATIDAQIVVGPTGDGVVEGKLRIDGTNRTRAGFAAVISGGTNFAGFVGGQGDDEDFNKLLGNISGTWSANGGFSGKIGGGTAGGNAVELGRGGCNNNTQKPETIEAKGGLTLGTGTVTVAGVTCTVPSTISLKNFTASEQVEIKCTSSAGTNTLVSIGAEDHHGDHG